MLIFWLAAAATSKLNCNDYCNACSDYSQLEWNNLLCYCLGNYVDSLVKRDTSPAPQGLAGLLEPRRSRDGGSSNQSSGQKLGTVAARTAMNAIMTYDAHSPVRTIANVQLTGRKQRPFCDYFGVNNLVDHFASQIRWHCGSNYSSAHASRGRQCRIPHDLEPAAGTRVHSAANGRPVRSRPTAAAATGV
jgi:hypothetical protein